MEKIHLRVSLGILLVFQFWISGSASVPSKYSLGISPQDDSYYKSNVIKCKDGSKKFNRGRLNDEFCDCPDGTDEPGTSACPEGRFYCQNTGHIPLTIFSSRVNDGICDCCDGSDEYYGAVNCPNTCWEAGKVAREKMKKKIQTYQEGVIIRKKEVEKGRQALAKDEADLSKLKTEEKILKELVDKLKEQKEQIEKAEEEERLKKEKEEKRLKEAEMKAQVHEKSSEEVSHDGTDGVHEKSSEEVPHDGTDGVHEELQQMASLDEGSHADDEDHISDTESDDDDDDDDGVAQHTSEDESETANHFISDLESSSNMVKQNVEEVQDDTLLKAGMDSDSDSKEASPSDVTQQVQEDSGDTSGLSKEELGRLVASRWTGEAAGHKTDDDGSTINDEVHHDSPNKGKEEDDSGYTSEIEDDRHKYDDDDDFDDDQDDENPEDHVDSEGSYDADEVGNSDFTDLTDSTNPSWLEKIKQTVHNVLSSFNFFKTPVDLSEADRIRKEYADSNSKLSKIQSRISSLTEKLKHDFGKEKEFYSFYDHCFEHKQNKYVYKVCPFKQASQVEGHSTTRLGQWESFDDSYRIMQFSSGDKCWNGPDRSLKVRLRCGLSNELADVDEPSRCEYVALLSTPALCQEDKLQELLKKLEAMNTVQPSSRDEL